jgi:hypothetical protein
MLLFTHAMLFSDPGGPSGTSPYIGSLVSASELTHFIAARFIGDFEAVSSFG